MDNLSTHSGASLYKAFAPEQARALLDKLAFVYTPKHGSWLMAELEFSVLARQCLARRMADIDTLHNQAPGPTTAIKRASRFSGALPPLMHGSAQPISGEIDDLVHRQGDMAGYQNPRLPVAITLAMPGNGHIAWRYNLTLSG